MISCVILTFNEEKNVVDCIRTLKTWCGDVVVFDSFSTDKTISLAKAEGARVFQRKFDNYASQRNAALQEVDYPNEWVLMVDADERFDAETGHYLLSVVGDEKYALTDIFHLRRKDMFLGRWLKHGIGSGTWFGRLLRRANVWVERDINEEYHCKGKKAYLADKRFIHYPFNNGVNWWIARHNRYSDMEAVRLLAEQGEKAGMKGFFSSDPAARRKAQKQLLYRMPCRPFLMFFILYFLKGGFLDGRAGFHYAVLRSFYEYMINLKMAEKKFSEKNS